MAKKRLVNNTSSETHMERLKKYESFIKNSNEGIWRFELEKPVSTKLSVKKQIAHMFTYAYLAEANDAFAKLYGYTNSEDMVGIRLGELMVADDSANHEYLKAFIRAGYRLSGIESHEKDANGKDKYFLNSLVGIIDDKQYLVGAWGTQQDVTAQHEAREIIKHNRELLSAAMRVSHIGIWEWDIEANTLHWTNDLKKIYGLNHDEKITYERYMSLIHPDDVKAVTKAIEKAKTDGEMYQIDHRVVWPDGTVHWVQGQGKAFYKDGKLIRMLGTARNIDQRKKDEQTLQESEQRFKSMVEEQSALVELNEAKDEFISLASHQLRTPATGVKQFIGMLLENYFGELTEDQRTMLEYAYESNERQLEVINDLLKVAQVDAGKVVLTTEKTDIADMLEDIMQEMRANFSKRKQRVLLDRPNDPIYARIDAARFRMVIENLIDNASKYTPDSKKIQVSVDQSKDNKWVIVKIKDQGVGINEEDIPKLFQKFSRLDNPLSIQVGGTGIGLYWAKKIIDLHNGKIQIKSTPGKGSTFTVKIPA